MKKSYICFVPTPINKGGSRHIYERRLLDALVLTVQESRKFRKICQKTKQRRRPMGCLYSPYCPLSFIKNFRNIWCII